jgi:hypothetical protein
MTDDPPCCSLCGRPMTTDDHNSPSWDTGGHCLACVVEIERTIERQTPRDVLDTLADAEAGKFPSMEINADTPDAVVDAFLFGDDPDTEREIAAIRERMLLPLSREQTVATELRGPMPMPCVRTTSRRSRMA